MEIEAKVKVKDLEGIKQKLISIGATFGQKEKQLDFYYKEKGKEMEPQKPGSVLLRIRSQGDKSFFTIKALTNQKGAWIEHEVKIDSFKEMQRILSKMNYVKVLTLTKERMLGGYKDFEICLDNIKGLGTFLEVALDCNNKEEGRKRIIEFLNSLGFKEKEIEHRGYPRILFEKQGIKYAGVN